VFSDGFEEVLSPSKSQNSANDDDSSKNRRSTIMRLLGKLSLRRSTRVTAANATATEGMESVGSPTFSPSAAMEDPEVPSAVTTTVKRKMSRKAAAREAMMHSAETLVTESQVTEIVPLSDGHAHGVLCGAIDEDRGLVFTGSMDRTIRCWDVTVRPLLELERSSLVLHRIFLCPLRTRDCRTAHRFG
jgi:hypothetical protein